MSDEYIRAMNGEIFKQGVKELANERKIAKDLCFKFNNTIPSNEEEKKTIIKELIGEIKGDFYITQPFYCDYGKYISIGHNFFSNYNCVILDGGKVEFGDDVRIGPNCSFMTPNHVLEADKRREGYEYFKPIKVGNNVWFGANVTVLPGVSIGDNSVIGAGSVVSRDIPSNCLAMGVPCKVIRNI